LLDDALNQFGEGPASSFTIRTSCNDEGRFLDWWQARMKDNESSITRRSLGYLIGYARIAAGGLLWATGLPLDGGILWMDRSVLKRFERDGYLRWTSGAEPHFEITPKGALLIAGEMR
jgi:hypothetical protein